MHLSFRHLSFRHLAALFALMVLPLRAQVVLTPYAQIELPLGHSYGTDLRVIGSNAVLFTVDEVWQTSVSTPSWTKIYSFRTFNLRPVSGSTVTTQPNSPGYWQLATFDIDDQISLFQVREAPPGQTHQVLTGFDDVPNDMVVTGSGQVYLVDRLGQLWRADNVALANLTRLTGSIASDITDLSVGADGLLYALDRSSAQVFRYSLSGNLLSQYTLSHNTTNTPNIAISSQNVLYTLDQGSSTSAMYDAATGAYLGSYAFDGSDTGYFRSNGSNPTLDIGLDPLTGREIMVAAANTGQYMSFYDITAIPEPSTYALLGGGACLAVAMVRRKIRRRAG